MVKQVSVTEAHQLQQQGSIYVDVRSQAEFEYGHASGAVNVPLIDRDPDSGQMMPNPDFVRVMQANFPPAELAAVPDKMGSSLLLRLGREEAVQPEGAQVARLVQVTS